MALAAGSRIGPYEITAPLGAGGMGEVYRARDARLNRDVAIKTLPASVAGDSNRMARFQREAQVLAALNHPNIASIYGLEEGALVMELVDGPTLAERIAEGPIPPPEAIAMARQIADALDAAHQKGIVHRDLKPANIKLTAEGKVKVLDFGLAKAMEGESSAATAAGDATHSPTLTLEATRAGVILGTAGYMAPEQARGKTVDKRADIWAFGVILYEMLSGRALFAGETVSDTLAGVLKSEIDLALLPPPTPSALRRLIQRCLERDPAHRLRDIGDASFEGEPRAAAQPAVATSNRLLWIASALVPIAVLAGWLLHRPSVTPLPSIHWSYSQKAPFGWAGLAVSRDGSRIAYYELDGDSHVSVRMTDQLEGKRVPGTEGGAYPEFSPDGQWLAYTGGMADYGFLRVGTTRYSLKKIRLSGGVPVTLADSVARPGATWGDDDSIVYCGTEGLERVPASGGTPLQITTLDKAKDERAHGSPFYLPGSRALLFSIYTGKSVNLAVLDLKSKTTCVLVQGVEGGRYIPTGHIVYPRGGGLFAAPFDLNKLSVTGPEAPVIQTGQNFFGDLGISDNGLLAYMAATPRDVRTTLTWVDRSGSVQPISDPQSWGTGRLSPDGRRVVNAINGATKDIWVFEIARRTLTRLTFQGTNVYVIWTPDGKRVAFRTTHYDKPGIYWMPADGTGKPELLVASSNAQYPSSWSPDGKTLVYEEVGADKTPHVWMLAVAAGGAAGKPVPLRESPSGENEGQVSPNGKWIAFVSPESGQREIYVQPFPGPGPKVRISTNGGDAPRWAHSGREIFYWEGDIPVHLMSVAFPAGPSPSPGAPHKLFDLPVGSTWDVAPDDNHFLVESISGSADRAATMNVIDNWFEEVRRHTATNR